MSQNGSNLTPSLTSGQTQNFNSKIDSLISEVRDNPDLKDAGSAAKDGVAELYNGAQLVRSGDILGGTAAILKGIGGVSALLVLIPGVGAIAAGIMSLIMGLVASILEALKPATRSLEDRIQGMITDESLKIARDQVSGAYNAWITTQAELTLRAQLRDEAEAALKKHEDKTVILDQVTLEEQTRLAKGMSWESLTQYTEWRQLQQTIFTSFSTLASRQGKQSEDWVPLYELTVQLALNFWIGFTGMAALIDASGASVHAVARKNIAEQLRDQLYGIQFASLNEGNVWAIYYTPGVRTFEHAGRNAYEGTLHDKLFQYRGTFGKGTLLDQKDLGGAVTSIAVSSKGTIFSVALHDTEYVLCAGRGDINNDNHKVSKDRIVCEQVFIGERPDGLIKVLALQNRGTKLTVIDFDDRPGRRFEDIPTEWTVRNERWGNRSEYRLTTLKEWDSKRVLSLAIEPSSLSDGQQLTFHAFKLDSNNNGMCCKYTLRNEIANKDVVNYEEYRETLTSHADLTKMMMNADPIKYSALPCTVSCSSDNIYAQAGNLCWIFSRREGTWSKRDLREEFHEEDVDFHQAYICEDGALMCITNKGMRMRYLSRKMERRTILDPSEPEQRGYVFVKERPIETTRFFRESSPQAGVTLKLLEALKTELEKVTPPRFLPGVTKALAQ